MFRKTFIPLFAVALIFILAACGSSTKSISVKTTDFKFDPTSWTVSAGDEVELTLANNGTVEHEWVLLKKGTSVTVPFDADDEDKVFWEMEAEPGETRTETFTAPNEPGTYTIVCGIAGHLEQGMEGTLTVE